MTVEEFRALKVDDEFKLASPFPKLSKAQMVVRVTSVEPKETRAVGEWMGDTLGVWIGEEDKGKVVWSIA